MLRRQRTSLLISLAVQSRFSYRQQRRNSPIMYTSRTSPFRKPDATKWTPHPDSKIVCGLATSPGMTLPGRHFPLCDVQVRGIFPVFSHHSLSTSCTPLPYNARTASEDWGRTATAAGPGSASDSCPPLRPSTQGDGPPTRQHDMRQHRRKQCRIFDRPRGIGWPACGAAVHAVRNHAVIDPSS